MTEHPQLRTTDDVEYGSRVADLERFAAFGRWSWQALDGLELSPGISQLLLPLKPPTSVRSILRRLTPASRRCVFESIRKSLVRNEPVNLTIDFAMDARTSRTFAIVLVAKSKTHLNVSGLCRDASTTSQLATALQRSESRWEMALESARQGVWDSDLGTGVVYHSRTWRTMRGMDPDAVLDSAHDNWIERVPPEDRGRVLSDIELQHSGAQQRVDMEYRERLADGRYIWISSLGAPVEWFADGRPKRLIGTDTDITARKEAEANVAFLSRRLEMALKVTKVGVFDVDLRSGTTFWDNRLREIYGRQMDEPIADWTGSIHPDDVDWVLKSYRESITLGDGFRGEFRIVRSDGVVRTIRADSRFYVDAEDVPRLLGTNWDVTEEVEAREDLKRAKAEVEARNEALEDAKRRIEHIAFHDMLTGLPNRRYLDRVLRERAMEASTEGASVGVLHIDLDRFKQINDTLGHVGGDAMLVHASELLQRNLLPGEFVARIGGDEFVIVCISGEGLSARLSNLARAVVEQMREPVPFNGHHCRFGASVGVAMQRGDDVDPTQLLVDADIALYRAKARGRNLFEFFTEALQAEAIRTKELADDILRGLEQCEFIPYYQPLFDARTREIVSVEALARWQHPTRGLLLPGAFLKVAEDLSVVSAIDDAILQQTLANYRDWQSDSGARLPHVSVNVSFRRLLDETLLSNLARLDIPRGIVSFELLESIFLDDLDDIVKWNISGVRDLGIGLSIDDFGTGHASILGLLRLRPEQLKVDRQFLEGIEKSPSQRSLVRSLIDIGKSLGIKVVAEGVETQRQATILTELGCDVLQGFALAKPMPNAELTELLHWARGRSLPLGRVRNAPS